MGRMRKEKSKKLKEPYIYYVAKTKNYKVQIDRKGYEIKSKTFRSLIEARAYRDRCLADIHNNAPSVILSNKTETLGQTINKYIEEVSLKRRCHDSRLNEKNARNRIFRDEPDLAAKVTSKVTAKDINDYIDKRLKKVKPNTVQREMALWKGFFNHSLERLNLPFNPVSKANTKRLRMNDTRTERISVDEKQRLLNECRDNSLNPILAPLIEFYFESGTRRSEALKLKFSDINYTEDGYALATLRDRKNSHNPHEIINTTIPLNRRATEIVREMYRGKDDDFIFPMTANAVKLAFQRARKRAGLPHFRIHDMRHDRPSTLAAEGVSPHQLMAITGHKDIRSTTRYINLTANEALNVYRKLAQ